MGYFPINLNPKSPHLNSKIVVNYFDCQESFLNSSSSQLMNITRGIRERKRRMQDSFEKARQNDTS